MQRRNSNCDGSSIPSVTVRHRTYIVVQASTGHIHITQWAPNWRNERSKPPAMAIPAIHWIVTKLLDRWPRVLQSSWPTIHFSQGYAYEHISANFDSQHVPFTYQRLEASHPFPKSSSPAAKNRVIRIETRASDRHAWMSYACCVHAVWQGSYKTHLLQELPAYSAAHVTTLTQEYSGLPCLGVPTSCALQFR